MTLTNPGAITNSGSKQFTNQFATVAKINYNRALNDDEYQAYQNYTWYAINRRKHQPYCVECDSSSSSKSYHKGKKHEKVHTKKHDKVHTKKHEKVHEKKHNKVHDKKHDKVHVKKHEKKDNYFVTLFKKVFLQ